MLSSPPFSLSFAVAARVTQQSLVLLRTKASSALAVSTGPRWPHFTRLGHNNRPPPFPIIPPVIVPHRIVETPIVSLKKDEASVDAINRQGKTQGKANEELLNEKMTSWIAASIEGEPHGVANNDVASIVSEVIEETSTMLVDGRREIEEIQLENSFEVVNSSSNKKTKF
ncbi:hypothetical protein AXF42_Ash002853 [Apostasia shenzhenica]|uniref:Uncharacterized protein n=1 Tax=Apostasia shenzhenica TaxID=1088818 RepID=A0A2I0A7H0_9ASPA|nr:hypothetical protein AXF42_Ash002853 [Apostasia shenzhenica]